MPKVIRGTHRFGKLKGGGLEQPLLVSTGIPGKTAVDVSTHMVAVNHLRLALRSNTLKEKMRAEVCPKYDLHWYMNVRLRGVMNGH
jgi:hypothetical protein